MIKQTLLAAAVTAALVAPGTALAVTEAEMAELRQQVQQLKRDYEQRIEALEKRLQQAENTTRQTEDVAVRAAKVAAKAEARSAQAESAAVQASARPASESAFNPAVSVILNGRYGNLSQDPAGYRIAGFAPTGSDISPGKRGFSLGESEIAFAANVDHYFRGTLIATVQPDDTIGVEEGYFQTLGLSHGLTLKAGRFYANIGYQNDIHAHAWDFTDTSLASRAFLGGQFADDGLQLKWLAPTDTFFELGAEAGRGRSFPGSDRDKNGVGSTNLSARLGGDVGSGGAWLVGLSNLRTTARNRSYNDLNALGTQVGNSFSGASNLWVLSGILKWAPKGNDTQTNFKLQGEYFRRTESGSLAYDTAAITPAGTQSGSLNSAQSGWYMQGVYQFMPRWRAGYRYDRLNSDSVKLGLVEAGTLAAADFPIYSRYNPKRNTLMLDFSPSEFSRLRLQVADENSQPGARDKQVFLQYIMSLGAHGAHNF